MERLIKYSLLIAGLYTAMRTVIHLFFYDQLPVAFLASEFNKEEFTNISKIKFRIENLIDPFERKNKLTKVKINESFPNFLVNNQDYYSDWILK